MKGIRNKEPALGAVGVIVFYGWVFAFIYLPEFRFRDTLVSARLILATSGVIIGLLFGE